MAPIAQGVTTASAALPLDGCLEFGPETPPQKPGEPAFRPRDPDVTGGYYQPVRVTLASQGLEAVALVRIRCNLPGASAQSAVAFAQRYTDNTNPAFDGIGLDRDGAPVDPAAVPGDATLTLKVSWTDASAERYVVHDRATDALIDHREAIRVSWFTTTGEIPVVTTGRASDDPGLDASSQWHTPLQGGGTLWAVMRDDRGGSSIRSLAFTVR